MFNIRFKGNYTDEAQLIKDQVLPAGAIQFKEGKSIMGALIKGTLMMLPLLFLMIVVSFTRVRALTSDFKIDLSFVMIFAAMLLLAHFLTYIHEFIHALLYPGSAVKEIWKIPSEGAYFVYCSAVVSKSRFIILCLAPAVFLSIIPLGIWLLIYDALPVNISLCFAILTLIMALMCGGDFYNVYNAISQVPKGAKIFNYGLHSYWIKQV